MMTISQHFGSYHHFFYILEVHTLNGYHPVKVLNLQRANDKIDTSLGLDKWTLLITLVAIQRRHSMQDYESVDLKIIFL